MSKPKKNHQWKRVRRNATPAAEVARQNKNAGLKENERFNEMCAEAGVENTSRQRSKYNNKKGSVYRFANNLI